jgi:hypothetical protein
MWQIRLLPDLLTLQWFTMLSFKIPTKIPVFIAFNDEILLQNPCFKGLMANNNRVTLSRF